MSLKKKVRKYYDDNIKFEGNLDELKEQLDLQPRKSIFSTLSLKKKWVYSISTCIVLLLIIGIIIIPDRGVDSPPLDETEKSAVHLVKLDVNPSIEFTLDEDNKVLSVYGVNDDGKMIIDGEVFVGKSLEKAIDLIIKLESEYGYLVSGNIENANQIKITVSSSKIDSVVQGLKEDINIAVNAACEKYDIEKVIETIDGYTLDALKELAVKLDPTLTEEKLSKMDYEELLLVVENYHLEVIDLASIKLEEFYQKIKNEKIEISKVEATNEFISKVDDSYKTIKDKYASLCSEIETYVNKFNEQLFAAYTEYFINADSEYQQALLSVEKIKAEIAVLEQKFANNEITEMEYTIKKSVLELTYSNASVMLESAEEIAEFTINTISNTLNSLVTSLYALNEELPGEIKTSMVDTLEKVENDLNKNKDKLMNDFEEQYGSVIESAKTNLANRKAEIKKILAGTPA